MRYGGVGFLEVGVEVGRFSGNPVSGADSECNREVTGNEAASGGTGQIRPEI